MNQEVCICIPKIDENINKQFITNVFNNRKIGPIKKIHLVYSKEKKNKLAFVYFHRLNDNKNGHLVNGTIYETLVKIVGTFKYDPHRLRDFADGACKIYKMKSDNSYFLHYEGNMKMGYMDGDGIIYFENNKKYYEGKFCNNKKNGPGTSYNENGFKEYSGNWRNDERHGEGTIYDGENPIFTGNFYHNDINP
mgnify:CR=1 FL=1